MEDRNEQEAQNIPVPNLELDEIHDNFVYMKENVVPLNSEVIHSEIVKQARDFVNARPFGTKKDGMQKLKNYYEALPDDHKWSNPYYDIVEKAFENAYQVRAEALGRLGVAENVAENAAQNGGKKGKRKKGKRKKKSNKQRRRPKIKSNRLKRRTKKYKSKRRSSKRK